MKMQMKTSARCLLARLLARWRKQVNLFIMNVYVAKRCTLKTDKNCKGNWSERALALKYDGEMWYFFINTFPHHILGPMPFHTNDYLCILLGWAKMPCKDTSSFMFTFLHFSLLAVFGRASGLLNVYSEVQPGPSLGSASTVNGVLVLQKRENLKYHPLGYCTLIIILGDNNYNFHKYLDSEYVPFLICVFLVVFFFSSI